MRLGMTTKTGGEANVYLWHHGNGEGVRQQLSRARQQLHQQGSNFTCKAETHLPLKAVTRWRYFSDTRHFSNSGVLSFESFSHRLKSYHQNFPSPNGFIFYILSVVNFNTDALTVEVIFAVEMGCRRCFAPSLLVQR
jgi:hypothetical protein